jgi:hypothetical protein
MVILMKTKRVPPTTRRLQRSLWGWSPPPLPARTRWQDAVDRWLPRSGAECVLYFAVVAGLLSLAPHLPVRGDLALEASAFLAAGSWCALNFWRCRQVHCLLTGAGWLALGALTLGEVALGHSLAHGYEQLIFLAVLAAGVAFEAAWAFLTRTNALAGTSRKRFSASCARRCSPGPG